MSKETIFVNRRQNSRRSDPDPCNDLSLDLYHRKRRKSMERRDKARSLAEDYYAFVDTPDDIEIDQDQSAQSRHKEETAEMSD